MDAIYPINPHVLFFIEGCGQGGSLNGQMVAGNWGDGFATDPATLAATGVSDPTRFFTTVLTKPYLSQVSPGFPFKLLLGELLKVVFVVLC